MEDIVMRYLGDYGPLVLAVMGVCAAKPLCAFALLTILAGCCWTSSTRGATAELPALPVLTSLQRLEHNGTPGVWMDSRDAGHQRGQSFPWGATSRTAIASTTRWGYLTGAELRGSGAELPEEDDDKVFSANVWLLGDTLP